MTILFVLIPLSVALLGLAIWGFFWMVSNDQFDDLDSAGWRVLVDEPLDADQEHHDDQ